MLYEVITPFPKGDLYPDFVVGIDLPSDQDADNDLMIKSLTIQENIIPPHLVDFEYNGGVWQKEKNSRWECEDFRLTIPTDPESPHIWVLATSGDYFNNDSTYIVSSCYQLLEHNRYIIDFEYWIASENGADGARLEYSTDNGITWINIDEAFSPSDWNWYKGSVTALGIV